MVALAAGSQLGSSSLWVSRIPALPEVRVGSDSVVGTGLRRYFSHGNNQSELATPNATKKSLQPTWAMTSPPRSVPTAGPEAWPAEMMELARPRWDSEKRREIILLYEGYATDSPMPRMRRMARSS